MNSSKLAAVVEIIRPLNVLMMMVVIATAVALAGEIISVWEILLAALVGGLVGGGANALNDYLDIAIDRVNKPTRPLPRGALRPGTALAAWFFLSAAGISLNLFLTSSALWIAVAAVAGLLLYSTRLKGTVLWGNLMIGGMTGLAFIYGGVVAGVPERSLFPALFAFLVNLGREILKDVEDMDGDRAGSARTLPLVFGVPVALAIATAVFIVLMGTTLVPYSLGTYTLRYLVIVTGVNALVCYVMVSMWTDRTPSNMGKLNTILKVAMLVGLAAIYFGTP